MSLKVDDFEPVSNGDLRDLWRICRDPALRRLILEVVRYRRVIDRAHAEALEIHYGLGANNQGKIVGAAKSLLARPTGRARPTRIARRHHDQIADGQSI